MDQSIKITGIKNVINRLQRARSGIDAALVVSAPVSANLVIDSAKKVLDEKIYNRERLPFEPKPDKSLPGSLYNAFHQSYSTTGFHSVKIDVVSHHPVSVWMEFGTTQTKPIMPVNAKALTWISWTTEKRMFSSGHYVKGVTAMHYMENGLRQSLPLIRAILRSNLRKAITNS
jgi:hypothetical protein